MKPFVNPKGFMPIPESFTVIPEGFMLIPESFNAIPFLPSAKAKASNLIAHSSDL